MKPNVEILRSCPAWRGNANCLACDGRENSFFAGLSPDAIATLHVDVDNTGIPAGETLYQPGYKADYLWVLRTGAIKLIASAWDGEPRIVRVLKPGDVAGIEGLLAGNYAHTAVTVGTVHACRTPIRAVQRVCLEQASFQWNLMQKWQAALRETEQWLVDMTSTGATARVRMARLLLRGGQTALLAGSAVLGALLVLLADNIGRLAFLPLQLPAGIVISLTGGPFFLLLLWQRRDRF